MRFAIVIRKQKIDNPWQNYRWKPIEVIPDIGQFGKSLELAGTEQNRKVVGRFLERTMKASLGCLRALILSSLPMRQRAIF